MATTLTMALYHNYITLSYIDWPWPLIITQYFPFHAHCRLLVVRVYFTSICLGNKILGQTTK